MDESDPLVRILIMLLGGAVILLVSVLAGLYALKTSRNRMVAAEIEKTALLLEEKQKVLAATIDGAERERHKIAEELHDQINAQLTLVRMGVSGTSKPDSTASSVQILDDTIQQIRGISRELMPPILERFGLLEALEDLFNRVEEQSNLEVDFEAPESWPQGNRGRDLALYRIAQEFIQNTMKYAEATKIDVAIRVQGKELLMKLSDNGKGFNPEEVSKGLGTANIRSRIEYLSGSVQWRSAPDNGVSLEIKVPLSTADEF